MELVKSEKIKALFHATSEIQEKLGRILVLSDSAHSIGAHYGDKRTGSETDVAIFSLHAVKNVTTAEGGAICLNLPEPFNNEELYKELRLRTLNCQTKDAFTKTKAGGWRYDIVGQGMKINLADVNAAIGLAQIRQYENLLQERKRVFNTYAKAFANSDWAITPPATSGIKESSYHVYALRIKGITEEQRDAIIQEISKNEVAVNVHFIPMPMLTLFKGMGYDIKDYPQAYKNYAHEISLPVYPQLTEEEVLFVAAREECTGMQEYFDTVKRPMGDLVLCHAPEEIPYDIELTYHIALSNVKNASTIQENVEAAVKEYETWQRKIGRDIEPAELIMRVREAGAKRPRLLTPVETTVSEIQVAKLRSCKVTYGGIEDD